VNNHPPLESRDLADLLAAVVARRAAYAPDWQPGPTGPGALLQQVLARNLQVLGERLNQAPVKNQMAFLDLLGLDTIAAQGSRAVVVFHARPQVPDGRVPSGTQVGAKPPAGDPIVFETEESIALAAARLTDVVAVLPAQDAYADHSAALAGSGPVTLFAPTGQVPHELYLAHDVHLALAGHATVEVQFDLAVPGTKPARLTWEYWDGEGWHGFKPPRDTDTDNESFDGTAGLTRSGVVRLVTECAETEPTTVRGVTSYWIRARVSEPLPPSSGGQAAQVSRIRLRTTITRNGLEPDGGYADQLKLDLTGSFYPLGSAPMAGAAWYLSSAEAFSKPGAQVWLGAADVPIPQGKSSSGSPELVAEMWVGNQWKGLVPSADTLLDFIQDGDGGSEDKRLSVQVPDRPRPVEVNGEQAYWLRIRVTSGGFVETSEIGSPAVKMRQFVPPMLRDVRIAYTYTLGTREYPTACLTYNDFQWEDHSEQVHGSGAPFEAFLPVQDRTPTLYLGFDAPLPADRIGVYVDLEPAPPGTRRPTLRWEYWNGAAWRSLPVQDETGHLASPGVVNLLWPGTPALPSGQVLHAEGVTVQLMGPAQVRPFRAGDRVWIERDGSGELATVESVTGFTLTLRSALGASYTQARIGVTALPRFGVPRSWLRARLDDGSEPGSVLLHGAHSNAVWATQARTIEDELLGASTGQARQTVFFAQRPVLRGEVVEVRELAGPRAAVELPLLVHEDYRDPPATNGVINRRSRTPRARLTSLTPAP
jgi:hypothetical protein